MKSFIGLTSAILLAAIAGQARAQIDAPPTAVVRFADLDLSSPAGRARLNARIAGAIDRVCPDRPIPAELARQEAYRQCRRAAWESARVQLENRARLAEAVIRIGSPTS